MAFDAVEPPQEIEMPPGTAEFAVGDGLQPDRFLLLDDVLDLAVFDLFELGGADFTFGAALARAFKRGRPQQAADMIGAEWRLGSLTHRLIPTLLVAISTIMRSFAHCSSSAENIALLGRGEAALRRQAKLIEGDEFRRLIDPALDLILAFQRSGLRW